MIEKVPTTIFGGRLLVVARERLTRSAAGQQLQVAIISEVEILCGQFGDRLQQKCAVVIGGIGILACRVDIDSYAHLNPSFGKSVGQAPRAAEQIRRNNLWTVLPAQPLGGVLFFLLGDVTTVHRKTPYLTSV